MAQPLAYLNGRWLPQAEAQLPLHDAGFVFGATVTDLCRTFRHTLYRLDDHLTRFRQSCQLARIPLLPDAEELADLACRLSAHNAALLPPEDDLALVLFATPGPVPHYAGLAGGAGQGAPTLGLHTFPLPFARYQRLLGQGATLLIPRVRQVPAVSVDPRIKQRSRLSWWLAEQEVHGRDPLASALLLDGTGRLTETAAANLLLVENDHVWTPRRTGVLGGVSLAVVEELCRDLGIPFGEADLTFNDCQTADEAFLSCTSFCLAPVRRIEDCELTCPGPVYERLLHAWSDRVGMDIREQILSGGSEGRK